MSFSINGKRVYLSGPITGKPDLNRDAFEKAERVCRVLGAVHVFNPTTAYKRTDLHKSWYMRHDVHALTESNPYGRPVYDALVVLDGYEDSEGAMLEGKVAVACGIPVVGIWELREQVGA